MTKQYSPNLDILFPARYTWDNAQDTLELLETMYQFTLKADFVTRIFIFSYTCKQHKAYLLKLHGYKGWAMLICEAALDEGTFPEEEKNIALRNAQQIAKNESIANIEKLYQEYKLNKSALDTSCTLVREWI